MGTNNYVLLYKRKGEDNSIVKVVKPPITAIETNAGKQSAFVKNITAMPLTAIQPTWLDFNTQLTKSKVGIANVIYVQNTDNELFSLSYRFDMGKWNNKLLWVAAEYLNFLSTDKYSAEEITKMFYSLACTYSVNVTDDITTVTISGLQQNFNEASALFEELIGHCTPGWLAIWEYQLNLLDGKKIDARRDDGAPMAAPYPSTHIIKGVTEALSLMHIGDRGIFIIPPSLGYGAKGIDSTIPPNATLAFDMVLVGTKEKSLMAILDSVLFEKPVTDSSKPRVKYVMDTYEALKKQHFKDLYVSQEDFNTLGYELIKKYPKDAIEFFKMNVKLYPESWNAYDSLGEGYYELGETKLALDNYEKSVKLNPNNKNGLEMIKKIKDAKS